MLRTLFIILLLTTPALAGPGDWTAKRYGSDETKTADAGTSSGNATQMDVRAQAVKTLVGTLAMTTPITSDEDGTGTDMDTVWYQLSFSGGGGSDPAWTITTVVSGEGEAEADTTIQGTAWTESAEVIKVSGDNTNQGVGELAVSDTGGGSITIAIPKGLGIDFKKSARSKANDNYYAYFPNTTTGAGTICRIRVDSYAKAHSTASTTLGHAATRSHGRLALKIVMEGNTLVDGQKVKDVFRICGVGLGDITSSKTEPPRGGLDWEPQLIPTDEPTDEEKESDEAEETDSPGDASTAESGSASTGD